MHHHLYSSPPPLPTFADYSVRHQPGPSEELLCSGITMFCSSKSKGIKGNGESIIRPSGETGG